MGYIELIKKRGYVENFKMKGLSNDEKNKVEAIIADASDLYDKDVTVHFLESGEEVHKKLSKFNAKYKKNIEAPHYLAFVTKDVKKGYEKTGYIGEWIISRLVKNSIDAAWLRISDHDQELYNMFSFQEDAYLITFIAIGHGKKESNIAKIIKNKYKNSLKKLTSMGYSESLSGSVDTEIIYQLNIREFVYKNRFGNKFTPNELSNSGLQRVFQELHFAPTITYKQLWRIVVSEGKLFVLLISKDKIAKIETGIMRFYLEEALKNNGIKTNWNDVSELENIDKYEFPKESFVSGYFTY